MLRDLHMLSLADHLVSTFMSTFSLTAQELIAARYDGSKPTPMVIACHHAMPVCSSPRPLISDSSDPHGWKTWWYGSNRLYPQPEVRDAQVEELHFNDALPQGESSSPWAWNLMMRYVVGPLHASWKQRQLVVQVGGVADQLTHVIWADGILLFARTQAGLEEMAQELPHALAAWDL